MVICGREHAVEVVSREIYHIVNYNSKDAIVDLSDIMVQAAAWSKHKNMTEETVMFWQNLVNRIDDVLNKRMRRTALRDNQIRRIVRNQERSFAIILGEEA